MEDHTKQVRCHDCGLTESLVWQRVPNNGNKNSVVNNKTFADSNYANLCGGCFKKRMKNGDKNNTVQEEKVYSKVPEKSVVAAKGAGKSENVRRRVVRSALSRQVPAKGKSRRHVLKKKPPQKLLLTATTTTSDYIFHKGSYWQKGDVVSVVDGEDGGLYWGQVMGFVTSPSLRKQASVRWLVPVEGGGGNCLEVTTTTSFVNVNHLELVRHGNINNHCTLHSFNNNNNNNNNYSNNNNTNNSHSHHIHLNSIPTPSHQKHFIMSGFD